MNQKKSLSPMEEQATIRRVYEDVARRVGLTHLNMEVLTLQEHGLDSFCECGKCKSSIPNMGITEHKRWPGEYRLIYSPGITTHYDTWMLASVMAHELGHVVLGHVRRGVGSTPEAERAADAYATRHGFADGLRRVMEYNAELADSIQPGTSWQASDTHPALQERIYTLGQYDRMAA